MPVTALGHVKVLMPVCTWGDLSIQNKAHAPGRYWYHFSSSSGCQKWTQNHMQVPRRLRFMCRSDLLEAAFAFPRDWTTAEAALRRCCQGLQHHQWCCGTLRAGQPTEPQPSHQAPRFSPCHRRVTACVVDEATTPRAASLPFLAAVRCSGAAMLSANSACRKKWSTVASSKSVLEG